MQVLHSNLGQGLHHSTEGCNPGVRKKDAFWCMTTFLNFFEKRFYGSYSFYHTGIAEFNRWNCN